MEFDKAKRDLTEIFKKFQKTCFSIWDQIGLINIQNPILIEFNMTKDTEEIKEIGENLELNIEMLTRNKMKCVFVGKTSNGKSATLNAIIGEEILPSDIGRTTSCFISIEGCDENEGFILDSQNGRRCITDIKDLANELDKGSYDINTKIKLFWPKKNCEFLQSDIELLDSPGVDYSPRNNKWIDTHCRDADVFVYVVDGGSTINESERIFFRKVKNLLKSPFIIILINKWDQCTCNNNSSEIEKLKDQHRDTAQKFLCEDLKLQCDINKRLFFVSATEALQCSRLRTSTSEIEEFTEFIRLLQEVMSKNATLTKCKPHVEKGIEYIIKILEIFDKLLVSPERNSFLEIPQSEIDKTLRKLTRNTFEEIRKNTSSKIEEQYSQLFFSITKGQNIEKMAAKYAERIIVKILRDIFIDNMDDLITKLKDELIKCSRFKLPSSVMDHYTRFIFVDYITMFEKVLPQKVCEATNKFTKTYVNQSRDNQKGDIISPQILAIGAVIASHLITKFSSKKEKVPSEVSDSTKKTVETKDNTIQNSGTKKNEDIDSERLIQEVLNQVRQNSVGATTDGKSDIKEIPESTLKQLFVQCLMDFLNKIEIDIEYRTLKTADRFIKDSNEINGILKEFEIKRKTFLDLKLELEKCMKNLADFE